MSPHDSRSHLSHDKALGSRVGSLLLDVFVLTLVLIAPLTVLLSYHGYAYFKPEVMFIAAYAFVAATIMAGLIALAGPLARTFVLAVLLALFIDMHAPLTSVPTRVLAIGLLALVAGLGSILWLLREHVAKIVGVIFVTLIALTVLTAKSSTAAITSESRAISGHDGDAPLLIHLLLDEHIGVEGLPPEIASTRQLHAELIDFYTSRGFRLFGGAYSQYAHTDTAIPNLLNFVSRDVARPYLRQGDVESWNLQQAAYFTLLQQRGYRLHVYQSTYIDLCHANEVRPQACTTYPVASLGPIQDLDLPISEKAHAIANALLTGSRMLYLVNRIYTRYVRPTVARAGAQLPVWRWERPSFGPLLVPTVFARLTDDILKHPRGHAFFAHLVLPHFPYMFDRRCTLRQSTGDWLTNRIGSTDSLIYNTADSRARRYERYVDQVHCVQTLLDGLLGALEERGLLQEAVIVVHGDHGSRIPVHFPIDAARQGGVLTETDYADTFSTLYAIKVPGVPAAYVREPFAIVNLLGHHLAGEPLRDDSSCRVFLLAKGGSDQPLVTVEPQFCKREIVTRSADDED